MARQDEQARFLRLRQLGVGAAADCIPLLSASWPEYRPAGTDVLISLDRSKSEMPPIRDIGHQFADVAEVPIGDIPGALAAHDLVRSAARKTRQHPQGSLLRTRKLPPAPDHARKNNSGLGRLNGPQLMSCVGGFGPWDEPRRIRLICY